MTPTPVAAMPLIVRRAGGLEAGEAPWRRTAFRTSGFFPSRRERTRQSSACQPAVEARNRTAAPRDCLPPRGPRSEPTWSFRRISPAPARMRRRSGSWQSARKTPSRPPTARVPRGRPWSSMLRNSSRQLCGSRPQPSFCSPFHASASQSIVALRGSHLRKPDGPCGPQCPVHKQTSRPHLGQIRFTPSTRTCPRSPRRVRCASRRHRVPPRAGEVHVASFAQLQAAVRPPWSVRSLSWRSAMKRRRFLHLAAGAAALPALPPRAWALDYPTRPVRMVVPYPAGIAPDIVARVVAQPLSQRLKQQFIVDNRPGGASNVGTAMVAHAPPDGYTLLVVTTTNAINTSLYDNLDFDLIRDFAPSRGSSAWAWSSWSIRPFRPKRLASSSPTRRPIPARSIMRRWAAAPPPTWPASCSKRWPASTW